MLFFSLQAARGQEAAVTTRVHLVADGNSESKASEKDSGIVVWLIPLEKPDVTGNSSPKRRNAIVQRDKTFEPHTLVVEVGSVVAFPNRDPFFHNVFSLFEGKRFDLGLYEAGATNAVRFDRAGVSYLFCNIHPEMSAVVVSVDTPYFALSDRDGRVSIANVPDGRYEIHYWSERGLPESLKKLTRTLTISSASRSLADVQISENPSFTAVHKNKYGQDYAPPPKTDYPHP